MPSTRTSLAVLIALALLVAGLWLGLRHDEPDAGGGTASTGIESARGELDTAGALETDARTGARSSTAPISDGGTSGAVAVELPGERELLRGRVVDEGRAPIASAEVELQLRPSAQLELVLDMDWQHRRDALARARTDAKGEFAFDAPRGRPLELVARAEGFAAARREDVLAGTTVELVLHAGAELVGRVTRKEDGAPVEDAKVIVLHEASSVAVFEGKTDAGGHYAARDLPPGTVDVIVVPEVEVPRNLLDVALAARARTVLDVEVETGLWATGEVRDALTKRPIDGAEVSSWSFLHKTARTDAEGRYRLHGLRTKPVPTLTARARGYGPSEVSNPTLTAGQYTASFELHPARTARGRVVDAKGAPVRDAYVAAMGHSLAADGRAAQDDVRSSRTDADGRFALRELHARARHVLLVRVAGHADAIVPFPADEDAKTVVDLGDVVLAAPAMLEGVVVGTTAGEPLADVIVETHLDLDLESASSPWAGRNPFVASHRRATSDARGRFAFADLAAGRWMLRFYREGLRVLEDVPVDLAAGETRRDWIVRMDTDGTVRGRVLDPWGNGVAGATVTTLESPTAVRGTTEADGSFALGGLAEGRYTLEARLHAPYAISGTTHELVPATLREVRLGTRDAVLQLQRAEEITGQVEDEDGRALPHAGVEARRIDGTVAAIAYADETGQFRLKVAEQSLVDLYAYPSKELVDDKLRRWSMIVSEDRRAFAEAVRSGTKDVRMKLVRR
jgi:protocatechuate 3,4-dioxygenase beta subunit